MTRINRVYLKHHAFNMVYQELKKNSKPNAADFNAPKKYHHAPEKLNLFNNYVGYIKWSNELYAASTQLISILRAIYDQSINENPHWYSNKKNLTDILGKFNARKNDLEDLYDDIFEFQKCMLATSINEKQAEIEALSDQIQHLESLENKIVETCNRKLNEISSSRVTYANLFIAIAALIVAIFFKGRQIICFQ